MISLTDQIITDCFDSTVLHLIILPTEHCNLRCVYCYEDFRIGMMKPTIVQAIKLFIEQRASELRRIEIGWFGGEPLLGMPVIRDISEHVVMLAGLHRGMRYSSTISTNATLLNPERFAELIGLGVQTFQVTLDGAQKDHDRTRMALSGKPTFNIIWDNLRSAKRSNLSFEMALRIHLTAENSDGLEAMLYDLVSDFGDDSRFQIYFKAVEKLGGPNDSLFPFVSEDSIAQKISKFKQLVGSTRLLREESSAPSVCYAAKGNSFVIRSDGRVGKCTVALNDPENYIGSICDDGTLNLKIDRLRPWIIGTLQNDANFAKCPLPFVKDKHNADG